MGFLQYAFFVPIGCSRDGGFPSPACETQEGYPLQEAKGTHERDGRSLSLPGDCFHKLRDGPKFGGDPRRFRPSELLPCNRPTGDEKCRKDLDNIGSLEGVGFPLSDLSQELTFHAYQVGLCGRHPIRTAGTSAAETRLKVLVPTVISQHSFDKQ